jgi:hypothetical protein
LFGSLQLPLGCGQASGKLSGLFPLSLESRRDPFLLLLLDGEDLCSGRFMWSACLATGICMLLPRRQ